MTNENRIHGPALGARPEPLQQLRGHRLLGDEQRRALPALRATDGEGFDSIAHAKLFCPTSRYTLFVAEFDGEDALYGYCLSPLGPSCDEWGYSSLRELAGLRLARFGGIPAFERDLNWEPVSIQTAVAEAGQ